MRVHFAFKAMLMGAALLSLSACATASNDVDDAMSLFGQPPKDLEARLKKAEAHPLGSKENPVRVNMPAGEHMYLRRLRCKNGAPPVYFRVGSFGEGVFGNIIDGYDVKCEGSEPAQSMIYMDMYFPAHNETQAVPGFTLVTP